MSLWTAVIALSDRICNQDIRDCFGITLPADKLRKSRIRWYGHVLGVDNDIVRKIAPNLEVLRKPLKGLRKNAGFAKGPGNRTPLVNGINAEEEEEVGEEGEVEKEEKG